MLVPFLYLLIGLLLVAVAITTSMFRRLPVSTTIFYLFVGVTLGPLGFGLFQINPLAQSRLLEHVSELAVVVSLFTTGLKLRVPLRDKAWRIPLRLAFGSMTLTVALVAWAGAYLMDLPLGAAILLGAVLAPTDPVLASEAQLTSAADRDKLRFSITAEAGLNDGTAFPFVMLGLGLLGVHEIGDWGLRWFAIDVVWAVLGGLALGAGAGWMIGRFVLYLRRQHKEGFGLDEFLTLGLIGVVYGGALLLHTYGFLAVFAAGLALRALERRHTGENPPEEIAAMALANREEEIATHPEKAPAYMAGALLEFNQQLERILEFGLVLLVSAALGPKFVDWDSLGFVAFLFLVIRPVAVQLGCMGSDLDPVQRGLISWLGIRGIGSVYYLMFAIQQGLAPELAAELTSITLSVVAVSILLHGISVTPLLNRYYASKRRG